MTAVAVEGLAKRYGSVVALRDARLTAVSGEVHGVLGENGAGKTTLLSVLAGLVRPDEGTIRVHGAAVEVPSPRHARALGVGMVHQHFALVPRLTVLENLMLGWPAPLFAFPRSEVQRRAEELQARTGLGVVLDAPVESLGVGERQRVEILKVLLQDPGILILDEPTAVLSPPEVEGLLTLVRSVAEEGAAVLLVAHKLDEVLAVAHRVTVLRHGSTVLEAPRSEVTPRGVARAMIGEAAVAAVAHRTGATGTTGESAPSRAEPVARLEGVSFESASGLRLRDVSLAVRPGEIVGVVGVEGNGQRELARVLAGRLRPSTGSVTLPERPAFVPQDRRWEGLIGAFDLTENLALRWHRWPEHRRGFFLDWPSLRSRAAIALERLSVRSAGVGTAASTLSGGNQQRVVLARELEGDPEFLVAENPTRGLDVAGEAFVHDALRRLRSRAGKPAGVVLVSTDLDEVLALADRFFVMVRGRLHPVDPGPDLRDRLGSRMLGAT